MRDKPSALDAYRYEKMMQWSGTPTETSNKCRHWKNINMLPMSVSSVFWLIEVLIKMTKTIWYITAKPQ